MNSSALYILWLPKYFDEYYHINKENRAVEHLFLLNLKKFLLKNPLLMDCTIEIFDKNIPENLKQDNSSLVQFFSEKNSIGYWGKINFSLINRSSRGQVIFSEFGFYYFEFEDTSPLFEKEEELIIQSFFSEEYNYPLLTDTQEDVLKETFLNDHLNYKEFNRKKEEDKKIRIEDFILEAYYKVDESDVDIEGKSIQNKILRLTEYKYQVKKDEYYNFKLLEERSHQLQPLKENIISFFQKHSKYSFDNHMYKKIILDTYEEQAISKFLTTVVSARYFDRITKSIKEVREGLTGKIIYMTPQDTSAIDNRFKDNDVFKKWSEEKIENYVQLLISKKPLFTKIDNALRSAYYITIGNVTSLGHINDKEDISQLMHYHEWQSLLAYFSETTKSLNTILNLYHSNRTYSELEEIKHYESNNHDKEDIELLIKSNENRLGTTEDSRTTMMMMAIVATAMVAIPDMIGSINQFPDYKYMADWFFALLTYSSLFYLGYHFFGYELKKLFTITSENRKERKERSKPNPYIKSSPDDFDILEHRSNMSIRTFVQSTNKSFYKKISILYEEHISTHRFVRHIEALEIRVCGAKEGNSYRILPEIVTIEGMEKNNKALYNHIKEYRTTKFSVNRIDKAKIKVSMRYRVNQIDINDFLDYYEKSDSYIEFYKEYCLDKTKKSYYNNCKKINSPKVIAQLKKDFKGINAKFSFVAIYAFSLMSKNLDHRHKKEFDIYKNSFRVYFHIDKYPNDYYKKEFELREVEGSSEERPLKAYDALSEMIYLVFLGRLKGFNYEEESE
jgi:hypothetical protein